MCLRFLLMMMMMTMMMMMFDVFDDVYYRFLAQQHYGHYGLHTLSEEPSAPSCAVADRM